MISKKKRIANITVTVLASLPVVLSGIAKLAGVNQVVNMLTEAGLSSYVSVFGLMELAFAGLFFFRRTMRTGLLLLSCYFGGAIATDLSQGENIMGAVIILGIVWIAAFVRDRSIFIPQFKSRDMA